ncbi:tail fiber assembly protein [Cronobacter turicensis]|uniref:tail fiber assembly protein n=1 Tax=Cronobacter turicensis TaxID=413502 RepID=UPI0024ADD418|nr:tail fiber assembly protein [Cronobacter turicensis]ELY6322052.1 tail fiber assembly protein [Cronobacter turicensis]MDI6433977.1 tail fiber assembly protein [Cronobacter turicensis]
MMKYTAVKKPVFADEQQKTINCYVKFEQFSDYVPFTATPEDTEAHSKAIYADCMAKKYGAVGAYVYDSTHDIALAATEKDRRLSRVTAITELWRTQLSLGMLSDADREKLTEWMFYAQALQAINIAENYADIRWPEEPKDVA